MSAHTWVNANLVRLHKAVLCANCDVISEGLNGHCAACGSEALLGLSRVLGGNIQSDDHQLHSSSTQMPSMPIPSEYFSAAA
jgi:hypothetical protein